MPEGAHALRLAATHPSGSFFPEAASAYTMAGETASVSTAHDAMGNVAAVAHDNGEAPARTLTWDALGRLVGVSERDSAGDGFEWSAVYDGLGRRVSITRTLAVTLNGAQRSDCVYGFAELSRCAAVRGRGV